jgi:hypothetical protein
MLPEAVLSDKPKKNSVLEVHTEEEPDKGGAKGNLNYY